MHIETAISELRVSELNNSTLKTHHMQFFDREKGSYFLNATGELKDYKLSYKTLSMTDL